MEVVEKLFGDLESNNPLRVEDAKKRLSENFSLSKYLMVNVGDVCIDFVDCHHYYLHNDGSRLNPKCVWEPRHHS